jgi:hypothetical protein
MKYRLGIKGTGRRIEAQQFDRCVMREESVTYNADFSTQDGALSLKNRYFWNDLPTD